MTGAPRARSARACSLVAALALGTVASPGCRRDIHLLTAVRFDGGDGPGGAAGGDGAVDHAPGSDAGPACTGLGPPITLQTANGPTCAAALSTRAHRYAVCTCNVAPNLVTSLSARLRTYAFDSTNSSYSDDKVSAAVGIDGALQANADLEAEGAVYVAGDYTTSSGHLQAGASFRSAGPLTMFSQQADLLGDAYVNGAVTGRVNVSGTLYVPAAIDVGSEVQAKTTSYGPVPVPTPCDCTSGNEIVDVASALAMAQAANGDAAAGFAPDALAAVSGPAQLTLGCGTYYLTSIGPVAGANNPVTLVVHGRALLAVAGDVILKGGLSVILDPSAELDLLVGQWLTTGGGTIGAPAAPARFRIWVGGNESLTLDNQPTIAAVVHAPGSVANASAGLTLSGSLFVNALNLGNDSEVHFDRAILSSGVECGADAGVPVP